MPLNTPSDVLSEAVSAVERQMNVYGSFTELERAQAEIARLRQELEANNIDVPDIDLDLDIAWMIQAREKTRRSLPEDT